MSLFPHEFFILASQICQNYDLFKDHFISSTLNALSVIWIIHGNDKVLRDT